MELIIYIVQAWLNSDDITCTSPVNILKVIAIKSPSTHLSRFHCEYVYPILRLRFILRYLNIPKYAWIVDYNIRKKHVELFFFMLFTQTVTGRWDSWEIRKETSCAQQRLEILWKDWKESEWGDENGKGGSGQTKSNNQ